MSPSCCSNSSVANITNNVSDELIVKAYGAPLLHSEGGSLNNVWCQRWEEVIQHIGNHYILPGVATGRHYVDVLQDEVQQLAIGNHSSERVLVFSAVILQHDWMACTGGDIHRLIECWLSWWKDGNYDALMQEASRCDRALRSSHGCALEDVILFMFTLA